MPREATFKRAPHNPNNNYLRVSHDLIRDKSISPECRWLIIYLLTNTDEWEIRVKQVADHTKGFIGIRKIYEIINEAINAGYMKREDSYQGNLRKSCVYYVSEYKSFSINVSDVAVFANAGAAMAKTATYKNDQSSSYEEEKKEQYKERSQKLPASADAKVLCDFFLTKIRERNPGFKNPNISKWELDMDLLIRLDKREPEKIKEVIFWSDTADWYKSNCLSPTSLRKYFDKMWMKMQEDNAKQVVRINREFALKMKDKYPEQLKCLTFDSKFVSNAAAGKEIPFTLPKESFEDALIAMFGGQRGGR